VLTFIADGINISVGDAIPKSSRPQLEQAELDRQVRLMIGNQGKIIVSLRHVEILLHGNAILVHPA
jgi:hypothetical protein